MADATNPCSEMQMPVCLVRVSISELPSAWAEQKMKNHCPRSSDANSFDSPHKPPTPPPVFSLPHKSCPGIRGTDRDLPPSPWSPPLPNRSYPTAVAPAGGSRSNTDDPGLAFRCELHLHRTRYLTPTPGEELTLAKGPPAAT